MFIDFSLMQELKAEYPIVVTLFGMFIDVNASQYLKVSFPIVVTLFGIFIDFSALQPSYLQPIITQYFIDNKSEIWLLFLIAHSKR